MNVFDFDNTIYDGESCLDFFVFCLKKDPTLFRFVPTIVRAAILYKCRRLSFEQLLASTARMSAYFVENQNELQLAVQEFWKEHACKLKRELLERMKPGDLIVTASPDFLMEGIRPFLPVQQILCSRFDLPQGQFEFVCYKENKVQELQRQFPALQVECFYTDSLNDAPLIELAQKAYLVKKRKITPICG